MLLECRSVEFFSMGDERSFFDWLNALDCVESVFGKGMSIMVDVKEPVDSNCLRELLAAFNRYEIDMVQLSVFKNKDNEEWFFCNSEAYWHSKVFPGGF